MLMTATTSRAVVLDPGHTTPEVTSYPTPEMPLEPGAVLVEVDYGGICGTDLHIIAGHLKVPGPVVLGHEAVGRVAAIGGAAVDGLGRPLTVGDRVTWVNSVSCGACFYCRVEREPALCMGERKVYGITRRADEWPHLGGGWADHIYLHPQTVIVKLPDEVTTLQAIALGCAGPTAAHGLQDQVNIRGGDSVVILGAGPVGIAAALYARLRGAGQVTIVGGPAGRLAAAERIGVADRYLDIDAGDHQDRVDAIVPTTRSGYGADLVVECAGVPAAVADALDYVRPGGTVCVLGQYTDRGPTPINPFLITSRQLNVVGSRGFSARHFIDYINTLPQLIELAAVDQLVTTFALTDVETALEQVRSGSTLKAVLAAAQP